MVIKIMFQKDQEVQKSHIVGIKVKSAIMKSQQTVWLKILIKEGVEINNVFKEW